MRKLYASVGINSTPTLLSFYHNIRTSSDFIDFSEKTFYFSTKEILFLNVKGSQNDEYADEETIAALQTLVANKAELGHINIRDLLTPGKNAQYKATLDTAYDALVKVEDALDSLELKLEYHHWRISSTFEELTPLLLVPRTNRDAEPEAFEQDRERVERRFQQS